MRRLLALAMLALAVSCGDTEPTSASIAGTWNLQTVNGAALPFTFFGSGANKSEITSDVITFSSAGTFAQTTGIRTTTNGVVSNSTDTDAGTWTLSGSSVTVKFNSDNSTGTGTIDGNTMTVAEAGFNAVYKKQ